jgi:hypothetical protein
MPDCSSVVSDIGRFRLIVLPENWIVTVDAKVLLGRGRLSAPGHR